MKITYIEKNSKNKDKFAVYIDEDFSFLISEEDYISLNLYEEKEMTIEDVSNIKNNVNYKAAKNVGLKFITYKFRSSKEVSKKLQEEKFENDIVERVIEELTAMGYINDKIYVQKYIYDRSKLKPKSEKLLKLELSTKGIESDIIEEILKDFVIDDKLIAEGLVKKKFGKYDLKDEKTIKKIYSFLQHRGFDYETIKETIDKFNDN